MIDLVEIKDVPELMPELKGLLLKYGLYMYDQLGLVAGRDRFFEELENLPGATYKLPSGTFVPAKYNEKIAGCAGIRKFTTNLSGIQ